MKNKRPHSCNLLDASSAERRLWHFLVDRDKLKLERQETALVGAPLPPKLVQKDWHDLYQPKLNIAWLPASQVFLRVVQLPLVDRQELLSMLEFQLEKLSPLPLAQVVWGAEVLPSAVENSQTAIVCIVSRDVVEEFLGGIEAQNYLPDRLEIPHLNQILADGQREDGAWLYPGSGPESNLCTVAWWSAGTLQELQLLRLPQSTPADPALTTDTSETRADETASKARYLQEQLMQMAWAGELEGWLTLPVRWNMVADEESAAKWQPLIADWADDGVVLHPALNREGLARYSAARAARGEPAADLLPPEFGTRYHQQYIDRLWMRGLGAVVGIYLVGVAAYMIMLQVYSFQQSRVEGQVAAIANTYTNVLQLKEKVEVLQEQLNLKYAALDSLKVAAELLPAEFSLNNLRFGRGYREDARVLELQGIAPPGQADKVTDYNEELRSATVNGKQLFKDVAPPIIVNRPGSANLSWNFQCELNTEGAR